MRRALFVLLALPLAISADDKKDAKGFARDAFDRVNAYRAGKKVAELTLDEKLAAIAQGHAEALAKLDNSGEDGKDGHTIGGKGPADRLKDAGYAYQVVLENVQYNTAKDPPAAAVEWWQKSKVHEANMRHERVTAAGVGAARSKTGRWFFVQLFARPKGK